MANVNINSNNNNNNQSMPMKSKIKTASSREEQRRQKLKKNGRLSAPPSSSNKNSFSLDLSAITTSNKCSSLYGTPTATTKSSSKFDNNNIRVVTRIRPLSLEEKERDLEEIIFPVIMEESLYNNTDNNAVLPSPIIATAKTSTTSDDNDNDTKEEKQKQRLPQSLVIGQKKKKNSNASSYYGTTATHQQEILFDFDAVLGSNMTQKDVYNYTIGGTSGNNNSSSCANSITNTLFNGINSTIIAYGQTGSGKTFTMDGYSGKDINNVVINTTTVHHQVDTFYSPTNNSFSSSSSTNEKIGDSNSINLNDDDGIIPRAIHDLFSTIAKLKEENTNSKDHKSQIKVTMTFIEIYNDEIHDLLPSTSFFDSSPSSTTTPNNSSSNKTKELEIRDYGENNGGIQIKGITIVPIRTISEALYYLQLGRLNRTTSSTILNTMSSRSHAICTLHIENTNTSNTRCCAKLTLVDLAGSERLKSTNASGIQQQEGISINTDLFALAKVISALADKNESYNNTSSRRRISSSSTLSASSSTPPKHHHIPYRDSKLTRILRDSLGGNCNTIMIACLSPSSKHQDESINTLRYAARTRTITNSVHRNVVHDKQHVSRSEGIALRKENNSLKYKLDDLELRFTQLEEQLLLASVSNNNNTSTSNDCSHEKNCVQQQQYQQQELRSIIESNNEEDKKNHSNELPLHLDNKAALHDNLIKEESTLQDNVNKLQCEYQSLVDKILQEKMYSSFSEVNNNIVNDEDTTLKDIENNFLLHQNTAEDSKEKKNCWLRKNLLLLLAQLNHEGRFSKYMTRAKQKKSSSSEDNNNIYNDVDTTLKDIENNFLLHKNTAEASKEKKNCWLRKNLLLLLAQLNHEGRFSKFMTRAKQKKSVFIEFIYSSSYFQTDKD